MKNYEHLRELFPGYNPFSGMAKMTPNELRRLFPNASRSTLEANSGISHSQPQPDKAKPLGDSVQGKAGGVAGITLRATGYRVRPLDPDNFAASLKDLIDALVHAHLLPNDTIWDIHLQSEQRKVKTFREEKTTIEIIYPE